MDLGCGTGYGCRILFDKGKARKVVGIDISEDAINFARLKMVNGIEFYIGDGLDLGFPENEFDAIVCFETIEHVRTPEKMLLEFLRILKPNGLLIISSPNRKITSLGKSLKDHPDNPYHVMEYSTKEFIQQLNQYFIYEKVGKLGDRLAKIDSAINWEAFRPIIKATYRNDTPRGGRPNTDEVIMVKLLVPQQWYGLSGIELERQAADRISFQRFLGFPKQPPDYSTVWQFRERLAATMTDSLVWAELQRQLDESGLKVRKGVAQDASIIEADPGQSSGKPRGDDALTRRCRDGDWAKRLKESFFGFKLHVKTDLDLGLIRAVEATPASVHDSRVDLSELGAVVYRDKGYFGVEPKGFDATMRRGVRGHPLGEADRVRNRRIGLKRCPIERTFAVIKRVFNGGRVLVTSLPRVRVKLVFSCLCFDPLQLCSLGVVG